MFLVLHDTPFLRNIQIILKYFIAQDFRPYFDTFLWIRTYILYTELHAYGMYSGTLPWLSQIGYYFAFYAMLIIKTIIRVYKGIMSI